MRKRIQRKLLSFKFRKDDDNYTSFTLNIDTKLLKLITVKEATEYLVNDYTKEWKLGEDRTEERELLGRLGNNFLNLLLIWPEELEYISLKNDVNLNEVIPLINPWSKKKWDRRRKGTEYREKLLSKYSLPNASENNDFKSTLYYPFPIISFNRDHNHTGLLLFEELIENSEEKFVIRTCEIYSLTRISKNIVFRENQIILSNCVNDEEFLERIKHFLNSYPYMVTLLFNCIHNENWKTKNVLAKETGS